MVDRFRLIYLKSPESEEPDLDGSYLSHDSGEMLREVPSSTECSRSETFSVQTVLAQAKVDLKHSNPKVRILAIQYLEKADPSLAIPLLQEILSDHDPVVRAQVISSLIKFRNPTVTPLIKKSLGDSDPRVRIVALRGVFKLEERVDLNILLQFLNDESSCVRRKVATLLGWTQMEDVFPILIKMSKDPDPKVRKAALFSLVTLYPDESEHRLVEAMTDTDRDLQKWAKNTLEQKVARPLKERALSIEKRG